MLVPCACSQQVICLQNFFKRTNTLLSVKLNVVTTCTVVSVCLDVLVLITFEQFEKF